MMVLGVEFKPNKLNSGFTAFLQCTIMGAWTKATSYLVPLVLLPILSLARVTTFDQCKEYFVNGVSPTVLGDPSNSGRYQQICQCLLDQNGKPQYFYATLYDTQNKIPVYSAYNLSHVDMKREDRWYVEPQVSVMVTLSLCSSTSMNFCRLVSD